MQPIIFLEKNFCDLDQLNARIEVEDAVATNTGESSLDFLRNRNNVSGWVTTDSTDAANTVLTTFLGDTYDVDWIQFIKHNWKNYVVEYRDPQDVWQVVETVTNDEDDTKIIRLSNTIPADAIRVTINSTKIADADKELRQLVISKIYAQFEGSPVIKRPTHSTNKKKNRMLSGKLNIVNSRGAFSCELEVRLTTNSNDLELHERLYEELEGKHILLSGGDEDQFATKRKGYRNEDIYLVKPSDEYQNPYYKGVYKLGIKIRMRLSEVTF